MLTSSLKPAVLAIGLSVVASGLFAAQAQAYQCKNTFTQVETIGHGMLLAKANGRSAWTNTVKNNDGLPWSVWTIAASDSQTCQKTGSNWYCVTKAKPCLYVVQ